MTVLNDIFYGSVTKHFSRRLLGPILIFKIHTARLRIEKNQKPHRSVNLIWNQFFFIFCGQWWYSSMILTNGKSQWVASYSEGHETFPTWTSWLANIIPVSNAIAQYRGENILLHPSTRNSHQNRRIKYKTILRYKICEKKNYKTKNK